MKHFMIEVTYTAAPEKVAATLVEHRAFLQIGYDRGWLLMSGPQVPKTGGLVIARAPSMDDIREFFRSDPYLLRGLANYRFVEFEPVKNQPFMADWIAGK